jgi:hypothetical protein
MAEVRKRYRIAVAATTVLELLRSVKPGTAAYFSQDQAKFRACRCGDEFARYMELPVDFAMNRILGIPNANRDESKRYVKAVLKARSQAEFFKGFDPHKFERVFNEDASHYSKWLENAKSGKYGFPTPQAWGATYWSNYEGFNAISQEQATKLAEGLTALYSYEKAVFGIADGNESLNTEKRKSDWVDAQQLVYLCVPDMHLLTDDRKLKERASTSTQSDRILILPDLMKDLVGGA